MKSLEIFLTYKCNYRCGFCFENDFVKSDIFVGQEVLQIIYSGFQKGYNHIVFTGGEPTLDAQLPEYISYAKAVGFREILIHTNGFRISEFDYLVDLHTRGLTGVFLSIHGIGKISNLITKHQKSFEYIEKSLVNIYTLRKTKDVHFRVDTNTVVCSYNYRFLLQIIRYLSRFGIGRIAFTYPNSHTGEKIKNEYIVSYREIIPFMEQVTLFVKLHGIVDFVIQGFPPCVLRPSDRQYLRTEGLNLQKEKNIFSDFSSDHFDKGFQKIASCNSCDMNKTCHGFSRTYIQKYKNSDLSF